MNELNKKELDATIAMAKSRLERYLDHDVVIDYEVLDDIQLFSKSVQIKIKLGDYLYSGVHAIVDLNNPDYAYRVLTNTVNDFIYQFIKYAAKKV